MQHPRRVRQRHPAAAVVGCDAADLPYASVLALQLASVPGRRDDVLIRSLNGSSWRRR